MITLDIFGSAPELSMASGLWTPTLTPTTNLDAAVLNSAFYYRIGDLVTVFLYVSLDPTSAASTVLDITIPIASDFSATSQASGIIASQQGEVGRVDASTALNGLTAAFTAAVTTSHPFQIVACYRIM